MNIEKIESIWDELNNIREADFKYGQSLHIFNRVKLKLRKILDEAHENIKEELLPFDLETAIAEPDRVVSCGDTDYKLVRFTVNEEVLDFPISSVIFYTVSESYFNYFFTSKGESERDDIFLKLKPKPQKQDGVEIIIELRFDDCIKTHKEFLELQQNET